MTKKNKPTTLGDLRSLLATTPPTRSTWNKLARALYFFDGREPLHEVVLPYCATELERHWPDAAVLERHAHQHWFYQDDGAIRAPLHPAIGLATHVSLTNTEVDRELLEVIRDACALGALSALELCGISHDLDAIAELLMDPACANLRALKLELLGYLDDRLVDALIAAPWTSQLTRLALSGGISDDGLSKLADADNLHGLRWLDLSYNSLTDSSLRRLTEMKSLRDLGSLTLLGNKLSEDAGELANALTSTFERDVLTEAWNEYYWDAFE